LPLISGFRLPQDQTAKCDDLPAQVQAASTRQDTLDEDVPEEDERDDDEPAEVEEELEGDVHDDVEDEIENVSRRTRWINFETTSRLASHER